MSIEDEIKFTPCDESELVSLGPICSWSTVFHEDADLYAVQTSLRFNETFGALFLFSPGSQIVTIYDQIGEEEWEESEVIEKYITVEAYVRMEPDFAHPKFEEHAAIFMVENYWDSSEVGCAELLQLFASEFVGAARTPTANQEVPNI